MIKYNGKALNHVGLHRSRDSPLYGKYPGHRYNPYYPKRSSIVAVESKVTKPSREERDLRRAGYGGRKEGDRER